MQLKRINPQTIPNTVGNYSHAIEVSGNSSHLYISGQVPEKLNGEIPDDFESQCEIIWNNISNILKDAEMDFRNIVKVTTFLTDSKFAEKNGEIRRKFLGQNQPALTVVVVQTLNPKWLLEIEAIAVSAG